MTIYRYKGIQHTKVIQGIIEATTAAECLHKLTSRKVHVIWYYPSKVIRFKHLSFQDSLSLCTHLEYLLKAHLSLPTALYYISLQAAPNVRRLTLSLQKKIEGGFSLSEALQSEKFFFDSIFIALIKVGETNGNMAQAFSEIKIYLTWKNKFQKTLLQSLRYPFILLFVLVSLLATLTIFLIPPLRSFLISAGIEQSFSTKLLLGFTDACSTYGTTVLLSIGMLAIGITSLLQVRKVKFLGHILLIRCPFLGSFLIKLWVIRISMNLAILLKSGIFLTDALEIVTTQTRNLYLKSSLENIRTLLTKGQSLAESLRAFKPLPSFMYHFIKAGEQSNKLIESFLTLRDYYTETLQYQIDFLRDFLPTTCLLFIGAVLIWIILGVFYPLYDLSIGL